MTPLGIEIVKYIIELAGIALGLYIAITKAQAKTDGKLDTLNLLFAAHEKKDDERFTQTDENVKVKIDGLSKTLDTHIADRKIDQQNMYTKLESISNTLSDVRVKVAEK